MKSPKLALLVAATVGTLFSAACSTTKGFGQDLQKLGNTLENEADASGGTAPATPAPPTYSAPSQAPAAY